jgi:hypothetical protein
MVTRRKAMALIVAGAWVVGCTELIGANWDQQQSPPGDASPEVLIHLAEAGTEASQGDAGQPETGTVDSGPPTMNCGYLEEGGGDYCTCFGTRDEGGIPSNDGSCAAAALTDPGACCASPDWPAFGADCTCQAFLCYPQISLFGGGMTCGYGAPGNGFTDAAPTLSATGNACCVSLGGDAGVTSCNCYDAGDACAGHTPVASCTRDATPFCSSFTTFGYRSVQSCR